MMSHLNEEQICALAAGALFPDSDAAIYGHLEGCSDCLIAAAAAARASTPFAEADGVRGTTLAERFIVRRLLGRGGMGEVLLAHDTVLSEQVAVKLLRPHIADSDAAVERLRRELVLGRRITHPNVCRVYDVGRADGQLFISMELVVGRSLAACVTARQLDANAAFAGALQLCDAVQAIHDAGVVHRDLKPSNVLVEASGRFVVADFGLAADVRHGDASQAQVGTPRYWAPEQLRGEAATRRTDIHATGMVLDELFASAMTETERARFVPILERCGAADPADRYASATELRAALVRARRGVVPNRRLGPVVLAASLVAMLWAGLGGLALASGDGPAAVRVAAVEPATTTEDPVPEAPAAAPKVEVPVPVPMPVPVPEEPIPVATSTAPTLVPAVHAEPEKTTARRRAPKRRRNKRRPAEAPKQKLWFFET